MLGLGDIVHYGLPHRRQRKRAAPMGEPMAASKNFTAQNAAQSNVVALQPHRPRGDRKAISRGNLSGAQRAWLTRGLEQPGGKLPLFDRDGQKFSDRTVRSCIRHGFAEPWFDNPIKPDWLVCRLTDKGRIALDV
jgi:hypothetical protein